VAAKGRAKTIPMKRAVLYLRVSTLDQTTANQERELREVAERMGCEIVHVYKDHGISGAKDRDKRPAFNALMRDANQRKFDLVMAWSVDRLGRSLQDLVGFLSELHALHIDLFLHLDLSSRFLPAAGTTAAFDFTEWSACSSDSSTQTLRAFFQVRKARRGASSMKPPRGAK
jgi:Resolvase, N terminal domain